MISRYAKKALKDLKPYKAASQEIWKNTNENIIKLDWNEGTEEPPSFIKNDIEEYTEKDFLRFYPNIENTELIKRLSDFISCKESNLTYFSGIDHLHEYLATCFVSDGDQIDIVYPTYDNFRSVIECAGGHINYVDQNRITNENSFETDSKIFYIVNPNNPSGKLFDKSLLKKIIRKNKSTLFIVDEAYIEYSGLDNSLCPLIEDNLLVCRTFSKAFSLAGLRIGYAVAHEELIETLNLVRNPKSVTMFAQIGAISALKNISYMYEHVNKVSEHKNLFENYLKTNFKDIEVSESHSSFLLLNFQSSKQKDNFKVNLLNKNIYVRDSSKMVENSLRITIPVDENFKELINVLEQYKKT